MDIGDTCMLDHVRVGVEKLGSHCSHVVLGAPGNHLGEPVRAEDLNIII